MGHIPGKGKGPRYEEGPESRGLSRPWAVNKVRVQIILVRTKDRVTRLNLAYEAIQKAWQGKESSVWAPEENQTLILPTLWLHGICENRGDWAPIGSLLSFGPLVEISPLLRVNR